MLVPSIFKENLLDDWTDPFNNDFFMGNNPLYGKHAKNIMKTDIRETESSYELDIDLAGFKKENIKVLLNEGYININASKGLEKQNSDKDGHYIRHERYSGSMSRSFFVGESIKQEDISAKFESGILKISIPKKAIESETSDKKYISIEG